MCYINFYIALLWLFLSQLEGKMLPLLLELGVQKTCRLNETGNCNDAINLEHLQQLQQYMQPDVDPCQDFHGYACGNWRALHGNEEHSAMSLSGRRINERYVQLFDRLARDKLAQQPLLPVYEKLLHYYETCKNSELHDKLKLQGYLEQLPEMAHLHWLELLALLGRYGYGEHFVRIAVSQHNTTQHNVVIVPHKTYTSLNLTEQLFEALQHYMIPTRLNLTTLRSEFGKLEADLALIVTQNTQQTDDETLSYYTVEQLVRGCGELNWQRAFSIQFGQALAPQHLLLVDELPAIKKLAQYLNHADPTLLRLYSLARFLHYLLQRPHNPLAKAHGANPYNCVRHMRKTLYLAMNYAYEQFYYAPQRAADERILHAVFAELKAQFALTLKANEMRIMPDILQAMLGKLEGVRLNVGNMPLNASLQFFAECVEHLHVGENFYENHLESLLHYFAHLSELEREGDREGLWYSFNHHGPDLLDNIDATPYFYCLGSIIIIPYAYLQLPFYDAQFWPALLYGDLANTLGHELLHSFDTYFVDYDEHGNMRDYSSNLLRNDRYVSNVNCLNDSSVPVLNERTSDISGTRLALATYMTDPEFRRANGKLYFLQFAQFFCGNDSDMYHDAGSKRLNYTLAQMPEFAEVFGCAAGTPMNPPQRCRFW
ncbi:endothelin-converting enzyme 2 [Scaptodrosophila lebanonensis]|uniref:Endothelin-converting enzyme 2 n=1 Tax=Drosophila lebanonensis TaxID=7225 RepID=A0A6J2TNM3_DROLE|nr:endothelin-converting enzyme 2 [Scaptodrosophila lebanonensis]